MLEPEHFRCRLSEAFAPVVGCRCRACVKARAAAQEEVDRLQEQWGAGDLAGPTATVLGPEQLFARHCRQFQLPPVTLQHPFAVGQAYKNGKTRMWRFDAAFLDYKLGVEIQGVVVRRIAGKIYTMGGHADVQGMRNDNDKLNTALVLGWSVLRFLQNDVAPKHAIRMTMRALAARGWEPS